MASIDPGCTLCDLHKTCVSVCQAADGVTERADVLFVGEAPGADEDADGRPFVGQAGRLLRKAIHEFGIDKFRTAITQAVKCCPPRDQTPSVKQVRACAMYLEDEISTLKPRFIVPMGNVALRALTGKTGVTKFVGRSLPHESGAVVFPMIHPASVFHDEGRNAPTFEAGFEMLARALKGQSANTKSFRRGTVEEMKTVLLGLARGLKPFAIDIETGTELPDPEGQLQGNPHFAEIDCVAVAWGSKDNETLWCEWPASAGRPEFLKCLRAALVAGTMIAHNAVFETKWFLHRLREPSRTWKIEDTILFHHLVDENQKHGLEVLAAQYTDMGGYDNEVALLLAEGKTHHQIWKEQPDTLGRYCAGDALATFKAWQALRPKVYADRGLTRIWETVTRDAIFTVARAELNGRKVDFNMLAGLRSKWTREGDEALASVLDDPAVKTYMRRRAESGRPLDEDGFNPGSSQQVGDVLFKVLRVPSLGKTDGGAPSVKAEYIEPYQNTFPWIREYLTWKGRQKALEKMAEVESLTAPDVFLYGSYLIFGTVTGRLASANPNLQNFSVEARRVVVSRWPNGCIVEADYSQLELRAIADMAKCEPLLAAFRAGIDPHAATTARMYNIPLTEVTKELRQRGKIANFLLAYGGGPGRLQISGGLSRDEAEEVYKLFHAAYPELKAYARRMEREARATGCVRSPSGRLRRLPDINSFTVGVQRAAAREAGNSPVQGACSDINTWACGRTTRVLDAQGFATRLLGPTHDSGAYDAPKIEVPRLVGILQHVMVKEAPRAVCPSLTVPFEVEVKWGPSWGDLKPYDGPVIAVDSLPGR